MAQQRWEAVFSSHHEKFNQSLNLDSLLPKLNSRQILSSDEFDRLTLQAHTREEKIVNFVKIFSKKGSEGVRITIECLQDDVHNPSHPELADSMEKFLEHYSESNRGTCQDRNYTENMYNSPQYTSHTPVNSNVNLHITVTTEVGPMEEFNSYTSARRTVPTQPELRPMDISSTYTQAKRMVPTPPEERLVCPMEKSNSSYIPANASNAVSRGVSCNRDDHQVIQMYHSMIGQLVSKLNSEPIRIPIDRVVNVLDNLLPNQISTSTENMRTFRTLFAYLHNQGLVHELDVDLLCELFSALGEKDISQTVSEYVQRISGYDVLHSPLSSMSATPTESHFAMLTFHSGSSMDLTQASHIKDEISRVLQIPRHTFTLSSSRIGSIVLVWRLSNKFLKSVCTFFHHADNTSKVHVFNASKIELEFLDQGVQQCECVLTYTTPSSCDVSSTDNDVSSTTEDPPPLVSNTETNQKRDRPQDLHSSDPRMSPQRIKRPSFRDSSPHEFARQYVPKHVPPPPPHVDTPLQVLIKTLKETYRGNNLFKRSAGPKTKTIEFINLALVMKQRASYTDKQYDQFLKNTLHGSIDDIVKKKEKIQLKSIFDYDGVDEPRKLVLVEGAPGVGKTMLAMKICQEWANGNLLQDEYDLVFLVTLRRFQAKSSIELRDLVNIAIEGEVGDEASQELIRSQGERMLFIFEGWDELPPGLREESTFFFDIIQRTKLPKASVLITSRPTVTSSLYDDMDERHIEVLGFSHQQIKEYIRIHASDKAKLILDHLQKFPNLQALAHIPLTLSIICHVVHLESVLPPTLTELYDNYICNALFQSLKKHSSKPLKSLIGIGSLGELPSALRKIIESLCQLAINGFKEKKFVYSLEDLLSVGLKVPSSLSFDGFGLLTTPVHFTVAGFEQVFQFRHLSIQEFLAAYGIKQLAHDERVALLREFRDDRQFRNIWKFFSGITKLQDEDFQAIVISETGKANQDQLFLLHCLFEANNPVISQKAAEEMKHVLNLNNMLLSTTDCLCAAHIIVTAGDEWVVDLRACNIGEDGLQIFQSYFSALSESALSSARPEFKIKLLNLTHNRIDSEAITHLVNMIRSNVHLMSINLASNQFGDAGMKKLTDALVDNQTVTNLHFSSCKLTSESAAMISEILKKNTTLQFIYLGFESIGDKGVMSLASALEVNKSLKDISLSDTGMTSVGLEALANMMAINHTLEYLRLDRNYLKAEDCESIVRIIETNNNIILLDLSKNPIGNEGFERVLDALIAKPDSSIKKLGMFGCDITHDGLNKLVQFFSVTKNFTGIQLGCNHIGDKGAEIIGKALLANASKTVKQVLLENTKVTDEGKKKLKEICDSVNADRGQDNKLDVNYVHHALVVQKSNPTNYL